MAFWTWDDEPIHIERVELWRGTNNYSVTVCDAFGGGYALEVTATDELAAFSAAIEIVKWRRKMLRHIIWAGVVVVLGLFLCLGYGCSRPTDMDQCLKAGKTYIQQEVNSPAVSNVVACR